MKKYLLTLAAVAVAAVIALPSSAVESVPGFAVDATTIDTSGLAFYGDEWFKCVGIEAYATGPFRYKVFDRNGSSNSVLAPVDTLDMAGAITAGAIKYPVRVTIHVPMDSIRFVPAGSDTVWYRTIWE